MRLLPVNPLPKAPFFVLGLSVIRGEPLPVVDLAALLGTSAERITRYAVVRTGERKVVLAVDSVIGTYVLSPQQMAEAPPLLAEAQAEVVQRIATLDKELLLVLQTAHLLPEEFWASLPKPE